MEIYQAMDVDQHEEPDIRLFIPLAILSQVLALIGVVVCAVWLGIYHEGFAWASKPFNYHPLFMFIGLVVIYGDAILIYRVFRNTAKKPVKYAHASLHVAAMIFASVGLRAVFRAHEMNSTPPLYSVHSWLGLATFILFCLQWLVGFLSFLLPFAPDYVRVKVMSVHRVLGIGLFVSSVVTCLMGITELNMSKNVYKELLVREQFGNAFACLLIVFGILVIFLVIKSDYRRRSVNPSGSFDPICGDNYGDLH